MSPHRGRGEATWRVYVPTIAGGWKIRSTGTKDRTTARAMERMVEALGPSGVRSWDLLGAVIDGRLSLGQLYDAYRLGELPRIRAELADVDLAPYVAKWQAWLTGRVHPETAARYQAHLATLHRDERWLRSRLTPATVEAWLSGLAVSGATKRKYFAAIQSFLGYLVSIGVETGEPLARMAPPPANPPRVVFLDLPDVKRVVEAAAEPYRSLFAVLYGTALDLTTALGLTRRAVDLKTKEIHGAGTKTATRDRVVSVADWAWPYVERLVKGRLPEAPLFPGVNRYTASDVHRATVTALKLRGTGRNAVRLHDARHHWAVRAIRAGTPIELVARQLGHADGVLALRCYGRFVPSSAERRKWEQAATRSERST